MTDPFNLDRFVKAQDPVLDAVRRELKSGRKQSHWMWFVFPQISGLGASPTARHYAIASLEEARAFLAHDVLGPRLIACTGLVNRIEDRPVDRIFGYPDDLKFHSSMTLFAEVQPGDSVFADALAKFFAGEADPLTMEILGARR